jgi:precorrin-2 dehydrogenase/sirohydrochlorin ferrochelatase
MPDYYPIMLDVRGRRAIVVGGDAVAAGKASALAASGATVTVLGPEFCEDVLRLAEKRQVSLRRKTYAPGDLAGAFVVIAATSDERLAETIWTETQENGQYVNIVDMPNYCSFIVPSILRRDQLTIAVSTEGASPALAKRIRQELEDYFPAAYGPYLRLAALVRTRLRESGVSYEQRDAFFADFFTSDVLAHLIHENTAQALQDTAELLIHYGITLDASKFCDLEEESSRGVGLPRRPRQWSDYGRGKPTPLLLSTESSTQRSELEQEDGSHGA